MERRIKDYAVLTLKGMAMGAADVVPGVSGGTIAFIPVFMMSLSIPSKVLTCTP